MFVMKTNIQQSTLAVKTKSAVIERAAAITEKPEVVISESGRRVEHTIRDEEFILCYPTGRDFWFPCVDSEFAKRFRGADPEYFGSVCGQSLGIPVYEKLGESFGVGDADQVSLAITKAYQYALMYPSITFFMSELSFPNKNVSYVEEALLELRGAPDNILLSGHWQNRREEKLGKEKTARLVISGTAAGVNDSFVLEEIEAEIEYLRDEGFKEIQLFYFGLYGIGNARGDIRIPVACAKLMKSCDVEFYRVTFDRDKYLSAPPQMFAYLNCWAATHALHFTPMNSAPKFDFMKYYKDKNVSARELLTTG